MANKRVQPSETPPKIFSTMASAPKSWPNSKKIQPAVSINLNRNFMSKICN